MRQGEIYEQADGSVRYTWETPRGTIAVDVDEDGGMRATRCLGAASTSSRDLRDAKEATRRAIEESEEEY